MQILSIKRIRCVLLQSMGNVSRSYIVVALQKFSTCWTLDESRMPHLTNSGPRAAVNELYFLFSYLFCAKFTISAAALKVAASDDRRHRPARQNGHVRCTFFCIFAGSFRNLMGDRVKFMPFPLAANERARTRAISTTFSGVALHEHCTHDVPVTSQQGKSMWRAMPCQT